MQTQTIFLTGATGFIGRWLLKALLQQGHQLILLLRRPEAQSAELRQWLQAHGAADVDFQAVQGDLAQPGWGLAPAERDSLLQVDAIYHLAARFDWNLPLDEARRVNVLSLDTLLQLLDHNPRLQRLVWVGGYMAGHPKLQPALAQLRQGHYEAVYRRLGSYEASRMESYVYLQAALATRQVPWTLVHPCSVIGASDSGEITQDIGLLTLLDALFKGRLSAVPGRRDDWLPVVAVDYLAQFLADVRNQPAALGQEYWVLDDGTPRLPELVAWLAEGIGKPAPRRRIPVRLLQWILDAGLGKRWDMAAESLNFIGNARFDTAPALALAQQMQLPMPHTRTTVDRMVAFWRRAQGLG